MSSLSVPGVVERLWDILDRAGASQSSCFLLRHTVRENWRQQFPDGRSRLRNAGSSLDTTAPVEILEVAVGELDAGFEDLSSRAEASSQVVSFASKIRLPGELRHLSMMNLHVPTNSSVENVTKAVTAVRPEDELGFLLASGRFFHYYGTSLIPESKWHTYLAAWLMPDSLVSPRYIGHSLLQSYSALRLSKLEPLKPSIPSPVGSWF
jgi:hypothetical protein